MENLTLKPTDNLVEYITEHIDELKDKRIFVDDIDLSKYSLIDNKSYNVFPNIRPVNPCSALDGTECTIYISEYEYFLKHRKDISMVVREIFNTGLWGPSRKEVVKVFKNHDYTKTLFTCPEISHNSNVRYLVSSKTRKSGFVNDSDFVVSKKECVSDFIANNPYVFKGKTVIITDKELDKKYIGVGKDSGKPFTATPIGYKFKGQQNKIIMSLSPVENNPGNYYITDISKRVHIATPIYNSETANENNIITLSETKTMIK